MAVPRSVSSRRAALSYDQLKRLAPWPDLLIKDYQGIIQDTTFLSDEIDALEVRVVNNATEIEALKVRMTAAESRLDAIELRLDALEYRVYETIITTTNFTADKFSMVICRNAIPISITLKLMPMTGDEIHVKRTDGQVNIIGVVDGVVDPVLNLKNWNAHYVFNGIDWSGL